MLYICSYRELNREPADKIRIGIITAFFWVRRLWNGGNGLHQPIKIHW
ncbi:hypothetical protein [[Phormidium] sp. ETS-05]|nr:hypothetical protein [[Phormidium] sp. ETS-05]